VGTRAYTGKRSLRTQANASAFHSDSKMPPHHSQLRRVADDRPDAAACTPEAQLGREGHLIATMRMLVKGTAAIATMRTVAMGPPM